MKTALPFLVAFSAIANFVAANEMLTAANSTITVSATRGSGKDLESFICTQKGDGVDGWYYDTRNNGPYWCTQKHSDTDWYMLNAYRSGGIEGVHWKYTDNQNDGACLKDWKIYSSDGETLTGTVSGRTTTQSGSRRWCALPVYQLGGVSGKQYNYCTCRWQPGPPHTL